MNDSQWLQTWQAVCQKEAEMKISQQQSYEKFRSLEMKMRLMDLRVETAFKIRDEYLNKLLNKYPNWKPQFVSVGLPKSGLLQMSPQNKTELAISQLVDMDMLENWDEKITLDQLLQSKLKSQTLFTSQNQNGTESIKDLKSELEQVKKQLNDISVYLRDLKSAQMQQEQPKTTVSISRRQSFRDRDYSATEHIRMPKPADSGGRFAEAEAEDDFDHEEPKRAIVQPVQPAPRPTVVQTQQPRRIDTQPSVQPTEHRQPEVVQQPSEQAVVSSGPRFNFGSSKEPSGIVVEPKAPAPAPTPTPTPAPAPTPARYSEPAAVIISEPKVEHRVVHEPVVQKTEPKRQEMEKPVMSNIPTGKVNEIERKPSEAFFTDPIRDDTHSSTPESTPEIAKSNKVVKSYEALLGIVKESSFETRKKQDSDSDSSDDIEKRIISPPPHTQSKVSLVVENALAKKDSQPQIAVTQAVSPAKQSTPDFLLDTFPKLGEKKQSSSPPKSRQPSSSLLSAMAPKETKPAAPAKKEEPMSDPDDFLAKLFPDKFGTTKKDEKPKGGPVASLFGERKPKKSAFFVGDDSDSETVDIPKKKTQSDDDFDFFN